MSDVLVEDFGPHLYGAKLHIVDSVSQINLTSDTYVVDCETDEKDNCVGIGICGDDTNVYYFHSLLSGILGLLRGVKLVGHNLKGDCHWLNRWGMDIKPSLIYFDTQIADHVLNSHRDSHSLKDVAREELGMTWPTYDSMVHPTSKTKRVTLDNIPMERVARYNGMDCLATYRLWKKFHARMTVDQHQYLEELEFPVLRIIYWMEYHGMHVDVDVLLKLDKEFRAQEQHYEHLWQRWFTKQLNIRSPKQVKNGLKLLLPKLKMDTTKSERLREVADKHPAIKTLLSYREVNKLRATYTTALLENPTLPVIHTTFNQAGTVTGRLSSKEPNLQNIPVRTENGKKLRTAFISGIKDTELIIADYSQIEYRFLAHFSEEPVLLNAFRLGKDVHDETAAALGCDRRLAKTLNFAIIYGAQAKKIAETAKISRTDAERFLATYWQRLPKATAWLNKTKIIAAGQGGIYTKMGRFIALPDIKLRCLSNSGVGCTSMVGRACQNCYRKWAAERCAVSYTIQGSAAELIKKAMINLNERGHHPLLQVHDELLFRYPTYSGIEMEMKEIADVMENSMILKVPIEVTIKRGANWGVKD
jgi:DNA polymerase-1